MQITPQLIEQFPNMSETARNWISIIPECKWMQDYFCHLNECLNPLKKKQKIDIIRRLASPEDGKYHEAIAELAYISFWKYLGWPFEKDPHVGGKTPDFKVPFDNSFFFCDVGVVRHNHPYEPKTIETLEDLATPLPLPEIPIEQSHRFLTKLNDKFRKYLQICAPYNTPLVIAFFQYRFEDQFFLDEHQLKVALFGDEKVNFSTGERYHQPKIINTEHGELKVGVFTFDEYKPLSAIIVCTQESYPISDERLQTLKPHYPLKFKFTFSIYPNPFGEWADKRMNPFPPEGLSEDGLIDIEFKTIYGQEV